ncbi:MAG: hypothetical protein AB7F19_03550 [Candidatus Babeliales bacterium]
MEKSTLFLLTFLCTATNSFCSWGTKYQTDTERYRQLYEEAKIEVNSYPEMACELTEPGTLEAIGALAYLEDQIQKKLKAKVDQCLAGSMPESSCYDCSAINLYIKLLSAQKTAEEARKVLKWVEETLQKAK